MSSTTSPIMTGSTTDASASATDSSSSSNNSSNSYNNPGMFYKNLFYILIGLLAAFALVSFLSLARARRRRQAILREAQRLGVIVPGVPGYIPMRDRASMLWTRADGSSDPAWWEVTKKAMSSEEPSDSENEKWAGADLAVRDRGAGTEMSARAESEVRAEELQPLAIIPIQAPPPAAPPIPQSALPYFPNHLAYRPENIVPPAARFVVDPIADPNMDCLNKLAGERVEVVTIIRMPVPSTPAPLAAKAGDGDGGGDEDDGEEVLREWSGIELGIMGMKVRS